MHAMLAFLRDLLRMPAPWLAWLGLLGLVNLGGGLVYLGTVEGRVVLGTFLVAALLLMGLHARLGFVRLLGLGHFVWFPLISWLFTRLDAAPPGSALRAWLWAVIVLDAASLAIDTVDVARYLRGERTPTVGR
jgi:hypothetical protein